MAKNSQIIALHSGQEFKEILEDFKNESDRATVILGTAKLDSQLYILLSKVLKPSTNNQDELLDGDNPLGTFSAKINIAFRLGLIDSQFAKSLHLIRKIRNSFAHETKGITLTTGGHGDRVRELVVHFKDFADYQAIKNTFFEGKSGLDIDFRMLLGVAIIRLDTAIHFSKQIIDSGAAFFPPNWVKKIGDDDDENVEIVK